MSSDQITVETFIGWQERHAEELLAHGETSISIDDYGTRRTCKHLIVATTASIGATGSDYEVNYDEDDQAFVLTLLVDADDLGSEDTDNMSEDEAGELVSA